MEVQEILENKDNLIKFLKDRGLKEEADYFDDDYKEGVYFKIDKRKLLVVYEILDEQTLKEIKDHFLIDRGLSYCVISFNHKLIFFRNFGETKHFIYSERTKGNRSKIDKLNKIGVSIDGLFQTKDISAKFYEAFKLKRNLLVQHIKNNIEPTEKYLISQKIFDRFFFIYFLCHKGIIKFKDGGKVSGESLFSRILLKKGDFLENLKSLFHKFNFQGEENERILKIGEYDIFIPYLNGGLFRPDVLELNLDISLKNAQWEDIFEFLNSYHWIIEDVKVTEEDEDKILTPEILGHVYERSVVEWEQKGFKEEAEEAVKKITERKKKGVYYTPESITDYISNNTIIPYLLDKLSNKYNSFDELIESKNKADYKEAISILNEIRVLDPACGSGAFLIKASEVILALKRRLNYEMKEKKNFYDLKLDIITENIYGVDILAGAIEISKLRLWLWLISDFEESKNGIKALPNIEYNLVVGNSLIGWVNEKLYQISLASPMTDEVRDIFRELITNSIYEKEDLQNAKELLERNNLEGYIDAYYIIYTIYKRAHGERATDLKEILQTIREAIYKSINDSFLYYINKKIKPNHDKGRPPIDLTDFVKLTPFHWRVDFGHIIKRGGFDVVIGNPPYVQIKQISYGEKKIYEGLYEFATGRFNLFYLFIELTGKKINRNKGISAFIVPDRLLLNTQCYDLRKWLLEKHRLIEIDSFEEEVFKSAVVDNVVIFFKNVIENYEFLNVKNRVLSDDLFFKKPDTIPLSHFYQSPNMQFDLGFNQQTSLLIKKISKNSKVLEEISDTKDGIIQSKIPDMLFLKNPIDKDSKRLLFGKDVTKYHIGFNNNWINYKPKEMMKIELKRNGGGLRLRKREVFERIKVLTRQTSDTIIASLDTENYYYSNTLHGTAIIDKKFSIKYVLAILNSSLINWYYKNTTAEGGKVFAQIKIEILRKLPIKEIPEKDQQSFIKLVDEILSITKDKDYLENEQKQKNVKELQDKIDQLVYKLYDLTPEEIQIVEDFCEKK